MEQKSLVSLSCVMEKDGCLVV